MLCQKFPSGITVTQAKKDAKKLAKDQSILLSKAQDLIAFKHGRAPWAVLMEQLNQKAEIIFNNGKQGISIPAALAKNSFTLLIGEPSSGKSVLLAEIAAQLLSAGHKVVYLTYSFQPDVALIPPQEVDRLMLAALKSVYPEQFKVHGVSSELSNSDFEKLELNGAVLLIEEIFVLQKMYSNTAILDLLRCSKHTFVTCQAFEDMHREIRDSVQYEHLQLIFLKQRNVFGHFTLMSEAYLSVRSPGLFDAIDSIVTSNDFREFVILSPHGFDKVRFALSNSTIWKIFD